MSKPLRIQSSPRPSASISQPTWRGWVIGALVLVAITFIVYLPAMNGGFLWDDDDYVAQNMALRSWDGLARIWFEPGATHQYYPMVFTTFFVEYHLWGLHTLGYHVVNVLLHAAGALLLWRLLWRLKVPGAWLAAAIFALHPIHVESVAWIAERKNTLSTFFYLLAFLAYLLFTPLDELPNSRSRSWKWYFISVVLFALALFSKTVTCSFPAAVLLVTWWKRGRITRRDVVPTIPLFALGLGMGLFTAWMEKHYVWNGASNYDYSLLERFLIAGRVVWFYAYRIVWPTNLSFCYERWIINAHAWWQWMYPLMAAAVLVALWLARNRIGRGPLAAVLFFGGTLLPALGFFDVYPFQFSFVADHFQHLASIGLTVLIAALVALIAQQPAAWARPVAISVSGVILCALTILTWRQSAVYKDQQSLWTDTLAKNSSAWIAHVNLGMVLEQQQQSIDNALEHYRAAIALNPRCADAHYDIGNIMLARNDLNAAVENYRRTTELWPNWARGHCSLADAQLRSNQIDAAIGEYQQAIKLKPDFDSAYNNLGFAYLRGGKLAEAADCYRRVLNLNPSDSAARLRLGMVYAQQLRMDQAAPEYLRALREQPQLMPVFLSISDSLAAAGRLDLAIAHIELAQSLQPANAELQARHDKWTAQRNGQ